MKYYLTIFEENGHYNPKFDINEKGRDNGVAAGKKLGARAVYFGTITRPAQGHIVDRFIRNANEEKKFDLNKLEEMLKDEK